MITKLINKLRERYSRPFTKWYVKRGYTFGYDFTDVPVYTDGYLCPRCATEFRVLMSNFIDQDKLANKWRLLIDEEN